ncbi:Fic family protein [Leifsonia kafniensis]|uniref:Fic family protein n=1 Tax=Leifsonia kafniensis TaxID=475957 RepID=A0ABP7KQV0_9MICO
MDAVLGAARSKGSSGGEENANDGVEEILNIQKAIDFIDETVHAGPITHIYIRELHRLVVSGLRREGDLTPGAYRLGEVAIGGAKHQPPFPSDVLDSMSALIAFANVEVEPHKQLLQSAIVHHRFLWIHPFGNGNGRVSRLLTYAMLVKQGFTATSGYRALNPTAVFGADRAAYYDNLERADALDNDGIVAWCTYVLTGLKTDLLRLTSLTDGDFVVTRLLHPAIERLRDSGRLTASEAAALRVVAQKTVVKAGDLASALPGSPSTRSQAIRKIVDRGLLIPLENSPRSYRLAFAPNDLTVHIVHQLDALGFLPTILRNDPL